MLSKTDRTEASALKIGVLVNLMMAVSGWVTFRLTGSEAILLDGNFSFISSLTTIGAIVIIHKKHKRTSIFPYGRYFYESFFTLFKGILILGLIIAALFQNIIEILAFLEGGARTKLQTGPIVIYMGLMILFCFGIALYYRFSNKKINFTSSILSVESKSSLIDGYMTVAVGIALIITTVIPESSRLSFLLYIGDSIIVILMCLFLFRIPAGVVKAAFIELGGGRLQNEESVKNIASVIHRVKPEDINIADYYISKTGSSHLVLIYANSNQKEIAIETITGYRTSILQEIEQNYPNSEVEIVLR